MGFWKHSAKPWPPRSHQIIAQADGSVLAGSADGLVGLRQGKVQRMTTKNGLPCNFVISFIEDKEKHWWLYTDCGVVELADSDSSVVGQPGTGGADPRLRRIGRSAARRPSFNSAAYSSDGRVWFASGVVVQMLEPSRIIATSFTARGVRRIGRR